MLIEQQLEAGIASAIGALDIPGAAVSTSRGVADDGKVKGEFDAGAAVSISVTAGIRQHDEFSLPTSNIPIAVTVVTRGEMSATGAAHEDAVEKIVELVERWHQDADAMSSALSTDTLFAAAIRSDGGVSKTYSEEDLCWTETVSFTVRGTIKLAVAGNN